ncbi:hypothetical protein P8C59_006566 [Phyllachora maydis]|uniref:Uncharacterized protein n=1 Tax=Phyllachora maydis TaxID=1825666 RepID=A0AAD9MEN4_9PEZI|nr:hypothetical protein P8C59_006566 [Phyllachora maydis]
MAEEDQRTRDATESMLLHHIRRVTFRLVPFASFILTVVAVTGALLYSITFRMAIPPSGVILVCIFLGIFGFVFSVGWLILYFLKWHNVFVPGKARGDHVEEAATWAKRARGARTSGHGSPGHWPRRDASTGIQEVMGTPRMPATQTPPPPPPRRKQQQQQQQQQQEETEEDKPFQTQTSSQPPRTPLSIPRPASELGCSPTRMRNPMSPDAPPAPESGSLQTHQVNGDAHAGFPGGRPSGDRPSLPSQEGRAPVADPAYPPAAASLYDGSRYGKFDEDDETKVPQPSASLAPNAVQRGVRGPRDKGSHPHVYHVLVEPIPYGVHLNALSAVVGKNLARLVATDSSEGGQRVSLEDEKSLGRRKRDGDADRGEARDATSPGRLPPTVSQYCDEKGLPIPRPRRRTQKSAAQSATESRHARTRACVPDYGFPGLLDGNSYGRPVFRTRDPETIAAPTPRWPGKPGLLEREDVGLGLELDRNLGREARCMPGSTPHDRSPMQPGLAPAPLTLGHEVSGSGEAGFC